ncbi:MAG: response regulator [Acidobacteria bacterium]|nr:response regulator [Acidobacteriota bacterium]
MNHAELTRDQLLAQVTSLRQSLELVKGAEARAHLAEERLRDVAAGISAQTGPRFFQSLADYLVRALGADFALVGELTGEEADQVRVLGLAGFDQEPGFTYSLAGTPCENVIAQSICSYPEDIPHRFPHDKMLLQFGVEGYVGTPLLADNGDPLGLIAVMTRKPMKDVPTVLAAVRIFAARAVAELSRTQAEKERQRLQSQVQHAQRLRSIGVLAGGIAHDFNNLLVGILGNAGLALRRLPSESPLRHTMQQIETASLRAAELTQQLLVYAGKGQATCEPLNLSSLVEEMTALLKTSLNGSDMLHFHLAPDLPAIEADPSQIRQVIMNLLTNASEALEGHAGTVTVTTGTIEVSRVEMGSSVLHDDQPGGTYVFLQVSDTGSGMSKDMREQIFDPFFSTKLGGRGLGLAALLGIVRNHRGAIFLDSQPGSGTTFRVLFPVSDRPVAEARQTRDGCLAEHGAGAVLVVDDEEVVRDLARTVLDEAGYEVLTAADTSEAADIVRNRQDTLQVVLLDAAMPQGSGPALMKEIHTIREDLPVILSSGYPQEEVHRRYGGSGEAGFLQKPYGPGELVDLVRKVLVQS